MINGVINVYKEKGYTSHDVVARLRGILKQKKIGHTGTLDPDAQGVLPVCLGRATKLCDLLTDKDKTYETVLLLGVETDTQDTSGTVLKEVKNCIPSDEEIRCCIMQFQGSYDQVPPMYSALKVNGKKLYELAREGVTIERKARTVTIHEITILDITYPRVKLRVSCSKGTYIRTLCHDVGRKLGTGGCMEELLRTQVERFVIEDSRRLDEIAEYAIAQKLQDILIPVDEMFGQYRKMIVPDIHAKLLYNGNTLPAGFCREEPAADEMLRLYDTQGSFIGIYRYAGQREEFDIVKMFWDRNEQA